MRFAIRLPTSNDVATPEAISGVALAAEELGFWGVSVHDHLVFNGAWVACGASDARGPADPRTMYEALTTLAFVSGRTQRVRLMTGILLLPVREIVLAAKQVATIDALSGGRIVLGVGVGAGGSAKEATRSPMRLGDHALNAVKENATFRAPRRRGAFADEALQAMRRLWADDHASFAGEFVDFADIEVFPKPARRAALPILIGGSSPAAVRRAARYGDGWLPTGVTPAQYAAGLEALSREAREHGRAPAIHGLNIFTAIARTDAQAHALAAPTLGGRFDADRLADLNLVGSPETVVRRLREYQRAGVDLVEMKPVYRGIKELLSMMRLVAEEIAPALRARPVEEQYDQQG